MSEDAFTPKRIQDIAEQACEKINFEERELFIKQACNENPSCIEKVKAELQLREEKDLFHKKTTEKLNEPNDIVLSDAVLEILQFDEPDKKTDLRGKKIGGYLLTKKLGEGGMAQVYRGAKYDEGDFEDFAVKVIINQRFSNKYFLEETEKLKKVNQHPNIARLFESEIDKETNYPYFVLQYINGKSLTDYCEDKTLTLTKRLKLFLTVCNAVNYLHTRKPKIIHCDIKPSNILVANENENPFLIDFGIAKIINRGSKTTKNIGFTLENSAPELVSDQEISQATDIYSLGTVLYELLTGHKPYVFQEKADWDSMKRIVYNQIPELPSQIVKKNIEEIAENRKCSPEEVGLFLKGKMDGIILRCLAKNPDARYKTVKDLIEDINSFLKEWKKPKADSVPDETLRIIPSQIFIPSGIFGIVLGLLTVLIHFSLNFFATVQNPIAAPKNPERYLIQAGLCLLFASLLIVIIRFSLKDKFFESVIARDSFQQFLRGLLAIPTTWFWLYLYFYLVLNFGKNTYENAVAQTTIDFLNACTSAAFFYVFLVMDMPSVSTNSELERDKDFRKSFFVIVIISLLITFFAGLGRFNPDYTLGVYISGLYAAISMLYFFARLGSHHLNVNRWSLALLYSYASIQVIGPKLVDFKESLKSAEVMGNFQEALKNPAIPKELIDLAPQINGVLLEKSSELTERYPDAFFILLLGFKIYLFFFLVIWLLDGKFLRYFNLASSYIEAARAKNNVK